MKNIQANPKSSLADYILNTLKIKPVKTKSGKGFMIYQVSKVTDIQHLTSLVEACDWSLTQFSERYNPDGTKSRASIYIGHRTSANEMSSEAEFLSI